MSETEVHIDDEPRGAGGGEQPTPYQNLWVPLVIVPAGIVIAIVVVFALFGALGGEERSLEDNLDLIVHGGKNQREQALFNLARQSAENQRARQQGEELPWPVGGEFADRLAGALEAVGEDEHRTRLTLAALLGGVDERGVQALLGMLVLGEKEDPDASLRFDAISNLGQLAGAGLVRDRQAVLAALLPFLEREDQGLRIVTAATLGNLGGPEARQALVGALADGALGVRGTAAVALAKLEPPALEAGPVLRDMTATATYDAEREGDAKLFTRGEDVSRFRILALEALARLDRQEDWDFIEGLRDDPDANVVDAVLRLLRDHEEG